jgi:hypothetical protein
MQLDLSSQAVRDLLAAAQAASNALGLPVGVVLIDYDETATQVRTPENPPPGQLCILCHEEH